MFFWSESIQNVSRRILNRKSQNRKFFEKNFLVGIDSEWSKTYFKTKISISKKISYYDLTYATRAAWDQFAHLGISQRIGPNRILKRKSRFRKFFPIMTFLWGHSHFFEKGGSQVKKWQKNFWVDKIFDRNRLRMVQNVF